MSLLAHRFQNKPALVEENWQKDNSLMKEWSHLPGFLSLVISLEGLRVAEIPIDDIESLVGLRLACWFVFS